MSILNIWSVATSAITAVAGTHGLAKAPYAAHYIVDGHQRLEARSKIATLRRIATGFGREIANSVPTVVRANPFQPLHNMLGPAGERWVPVDPTVPLPWAWGFRVRTRFGPVDVTTCFADGTTIDSLTIDLPGCPA